jgi:DNA-binding CsgD family transcriptional regulator
MDNSATLSRRESEVAEMIAWGASKKEIAKQLFISERTVENHTRSIYQKANVTKSSQLAAWWFCRKYNISIFESPISRRIIYVMLLMGALYAMCFSKLNMLTSIIDRINIQP